MILSSFSRIKLQGGGIIDPIPQYPKDPAPQLREALSSTFLTHSFSGLELLCRAAYLTLLIALFTSRAALHVDGRVRMKDETVNIFKTCPGCKFMWLQRGHLLGDPTVRLIGYQVDFQALHLGLVLFNHVADGCGTTMALSAGEFTDLYKGPVFKGRRESQDNCPGHCLRADVLDPCHNACECAFVRHILGIIRHWPKRLR
jgi:hypothetical protein